MFRVSHTKPYDPAELIAQIERALAFARQRLTQPHGSIVKAKSSAESVDGGC